MSFSCTMLYNVHSLLVSVNTSLFAWHTVSCYASLTTPKCLMCRVLLMWHYAMVRPLRQILPANTTLYTAYTATALAICSLISSTRGVADSSGVTVTLLPCVALSNAASIKSLKYCVKRTGCRFLATMAMNLCMSYRRQQTVLAL